MFKYHAIPAKVFILLAMILAMKSGMAATVSFTVTGDVTFADSGNAFGLSDTDMIFAAGTFDDTNVIIDGCGTGCDLVSLNSLSLTVGNFSFDETDDIAAGFPKLALTGDFYFIDFYTDFGTDGFFQSVPDGTFEGEDDNFNLIEGVWDSNSYSAAVPIPAAVWLFSSGLIGLVGVARRKRNSV